MTRTLLVQRAVAVLSLVITALTIGGSSSLSAAPQRINGSGSTYVALAMQQWVADAQTNGLAVAYTPTGSPDGLTSFAGGIMDYAGTEAEFSALGNTPAPRGYQYVPDVAGAISVMYNVDDKAGRKVDYLHLSMRTVARIFTGDISRWSDPAISADNPLPDGGSLQLPDQPITVVYRQGQSGTTALFYDFVANVAPDIFGPWAARFGLPTNVRIIQLDGTPGFAPSTVAKAGSDQIAQHVASDTGKWSIAYDEFGYAVTYGAHSAWIQNASGSWVQPYAENISAALEGATLRPDLSQELSGVYSNPNPLTYPISAYSYLVTQCAQAADRATCKGAYGNAGLSETLAPWMRYIACEGQVNMARIGYSPLPPHLSQEMANSVARLTGGSPEILTADNCANPRFRGSLGFGAGGKSDPLAEATASGPASSNQGPGAAGGSSGTGEAAAAGEQSASERAAGRVGGGTGEFRAAAPAAYDRGPREPAGLPVLPLVVFLGALAIPAIAVTVARARPRRAAAGGHDASGPDDPDAGRSLPDLQPDVLPDLRPGPTLA